jgi:hypothetical protein
MLWLAGVPSGSRRLVWSCSAAVGPLEVMGEYLGPTWCGLYRAPARPAAGVSRPPPPLGHGLIAPLCPFDQRWPQVGPGTVDACPTWSTGRRWPTPPPPISTMRVSVMPGAHEGRDQTIGKVSHACLEIWSRCHTVHVRRCPSRTWPGLLVAWPTCSHSGHPAGAAPGRCRWRSGWMRSMEIEPKWLDGGIRGLRRCARSRRATAWLGPSEGSCAVPPARS